MLTWGGFEKGQKKARLTIGRDRGRVEKTGVTLKRRRGKHCEADSRRMRWRGWRFALTLTEKWKEFS